MKVRVLSCAEHDLTEALTYYEEQRLGLGGSFLDEFVATIERLQLFPTAWPRVSRRARRCLFRRFPYAIVYQAGGDEILIIAIMHTKRHPRRWEERLDPGHRRDD